MKVKVILLSIFLLFSANTFAEIAADVGLKENILTLDFSGTSSANSGYQIIYHSSYKELGGQITDEPYITFRFLVNGTQNECIVYKLAQSDVFDLLQQIALGTISPEYITFDLTDLGSGKYLCRKAIVTKSYMGSDIVNDDLDIVNNPEPAPDEAEPDLNQIKAN